MTVWVVYPNLLQCGYPRIFSSREKAIVYAHDCAEYGTDKQWVRIREETVDEFADRGPFWCVCIRRDTKAFRHATRDRFPFSKPWIVSKTINFEVASIEAPTGKDAYPMAVQIMDDYMASKIKKEKP